MHDSASRSSSANTAEATGAKDGDAGSSPAEDRENAPEPQESTFEQAMDEWIALFASRDEVADEYATCLRDFPADWDLWPDFNAAILRRWSPAGLTYIKERAWRGVVRPV
jgi:hypothetical protein